MRLRSAVYGGLTIAALLGLATGCSFARFEIAPRMSLNGEAVTPAAADAYQEGKALLREGHSGRAIAALQTALVGQPESVNVLNALAVAYADLGRDDLALDYFERALALEPGSAQTLNNIGYTMLRDGDLAEASKFFERARRLEPRNATVLANLNLIDRARAPGAEPGMDLAAVVRAPSTVRPAAWVERTSPFVQTIVTRPDPEFVATAVRVGVEPRLIGLAAP